MSHNILFIKSFIIFSIHSFGLSTNSDFHYFQVPGREYFITHPLILTVVNSFQLQLSL